MSCLLSPLPPPLPLPPLTTLLLLFDILSSVSVISSCLLSLLRELETTIEPTIALILRTPWEHIENVSGPSVYVLELVRGINQVGDVIREGVEGKKYERNFFDKAVG